MSAGDSDWDHDTRLWQELHAAENAFVDARMRFMAQAGDRVGVVSAALRSSSGRGTALRLLRDNLSPTEGLQVFDELVALGVEYHSDLGLVQQVILALPRDEVLARFESAAAPYLAAGSYEEYRCVLAIAVALNRDMPERIARAAAADPDPDIREAGTDYLETLD